MCIIAANAMSCQREITKKIMDGKDDYVLSFKENQPTFYEYAEIYFREALEHSRLYPEMISCETMERGDERIVKIAYYLSPDMPEPENARD